MFLLNPALNQVPGSVAIDPAGRFGPRDRLRPLIGITSMCGRSVGRTPCGAGAGGSHVFAAVVLFHPSADVPGTGASYGENRTSAAVRQISMFARSLSHVRGREHFPSECIQFQATTRGD
jgi:hypothetical protein